MEQLSLLCYTAAISTVKHLDILMESILILILDEFFHYRYLLQNLTVLSSHEKNIWILNFPNLLQIP